MRNRAGIQILGILLLPIAAVFWPAHAAIQEPVKIDSGLVVGEMEKDGVTVFKGIPFAAPPVGNLRWRDPQPVAPWSGVRKAIEFGNACTQKPETPGSFYQIEYYPEPEKSSEDCLYLNVWTAAKSSNERRPVMFWIYGGGFAQGSGASIPYSGEELAKKGVVVVTSNYRLGVLGFLAHPELSAESEHKSSGNYAMLDQLAALKWVHRNIAAFGGDPNVVMIFGQSGGSRSVSLLMASPLAKGLFERAMASSGGIMGQRELTLHEAEQMGAKLAQSIGAPDLAALRAKPAMELIEATDRQGFREIVDGYFLTEDVYRTFLDGEQNKVPLIAGSVANERGNYPQPKTLDEYAEFTRNSDRSRAAEIMKEFPASTDAQANAMYLEREADRQAASMRMWAYLESKAGQPVYVYYFDRKPPRHPGEADHGAFHTSDIPYFMHNQAFVTRPYEEIDRELSNTMEAYWVNFAFRGNPNGKGLPMWPAYEKDQVMEFGDHVGPIERPDKDKLDFFDQYYAAQQKKNAQTAP